MYVRAAQYTDRGYAKRIYTRIQETLRRYENKDDCNLSVYNLLLNGEPTIVIIGEDAPETIFKRLTRYLSTGETIALPEEVTNELILHRTRTRIEGNWVEKHYKGGRIL